MMKLRKIKLINWHIFTNTTIEIDNNTLITGENGSGKSTLLDALNYVLSGGRAKFNAAANMNAKRSVESYVRGKLGIEGKKYLRDQSNVISHIALEFFDATNNRSFVIGVVIEIHDQNRPVDYFYHIKESNIIDEYYVLNGIINDHRMMETQIKLKNKEYKVAKSKTDYEGILKNTLGLTDKKYFDLLPKALAFKPIDEVSKFVYDFLLNEDTIDIMNLKSNIQNYREIQKMLQREKEKLAKLEKLEKSADEYKKDKDELEVLEYLLEFYNLEKLNKQIENTSSSIELLEKEISELDEKKNAKEAIKREVDEQYQNYKNNDLFRNIKDSELKLLNLKGKKESNDNILRIRNQQISNEDSISKRLGLKFNFSSYLNPVNFDLLKSKLVEYDKSIEEKKMNYAVEKNKLDEETTKVKTTLEEINKKIDSLQKNKFSYPETVDNLIRTIKTAFYDDFNGMEIEIKPLCELLEIEDNEYRDAIEGYLNTQRFDLIIEPKYFNQALNYYNENQFSKKIHGVGLVNTAKINDLGYLDNSLASKVRCLNQPAQATVNMIMGKVICVDNVEDLKKYDISITKSGMVYKNHTARQLDQRIWQTPYIGKQALKKQLEDALKEKVDLENELKTIQNSKLEITNRQEDISKSKIRELLTTENVWENDIKLASEIKELNEELKSLKSNPDLISLTRKIAEIQDKLKSLTNEIEYCIQEKGSKNKELNDKKLDLETYNKDYFQSKVNFDDKKVSNLSLCESKKDYFSKEYKDNFDRIINRINNRCIELNKDISVLKVELTNKMNDYSEKFSIDSIVDISNLQTFLDEYYRIRDRNIIEFEDKAAEAFKKCENSFKEDFIAKLREKILNAEEDLEKLNKSLKDKLFGSENERYQFIISESKQPEFRDYYRIIQSGQDFNTNSLFVDALSEKNAIIMKDLFDQLTKDDNSELQEKKLREYTDYRKYMSYDIKITNDKNQVTYFSTVNREKSGGETQTPFYVIIAASFEQLIHNSKKYSSTACVVLFDEAFNNMDESRIETMMKFYSSLNIQLIIAVPPQRVINIIPYVETTLGVIKQDNTAFIASYHTDIVKDK